MTYHTPTRATHILDRVRRVDGSVYLFDDYLHCLLPNNSEGYELICEIRHSGTEVMELLRASGDVKPHQRRTPTMKTKREPLETVLARARRGESITTGMGPFYVVVSWPLSSRRLVCPTPFPTVEAAVLRFVESVQQFDDDLEPGFEFMICVRAGSEFVQ